MARTVYYQHDGAMLHFNQLVRQYLNHKFPNQWIGRGSAENRPSRSPDLNPLDYDVWGYRKAILYAHRVTTREELLQRILSAARSINNTAVLRKFTSSLVTRVRKFIQAHGGHFEQFAWVLKGQSVTVHLTTQLKKCTIKAPLSFLTHLLYFKNSELSNPCQLNPCVYEVFDSESALELNPEVVILTPGTPYIHIS
jgi:hypothetical protein